MSERSETAADDPTFAPEPPSHDGPEPTVPPQAPAEPAPSRRGPSPPPRGGRAAAFLAGLLLVLIAGVAASPFWAPRVAPLLPWGRNAADRERALSARLTALDRESAAARAEREKLRATQQALSRRLDADAAAVADLKAGLADLDRRLKTVTAQGGATAGLAAQLADFGRRLDRVAAQTAARPAVDPAAVQELQHSVAGLDKRLGGLADRIAALAARRTAPIPPQGKEAALALSLLQMRERVDAAQPFAAPYDAFAALARDRPALLAAAAPLAPLAHGGVPSRAALARDLSHLAGAIATARPAPPVGPREGGDWGARVLDQLRRLVIVRRLDGGDRAPARAAVDRAESDLARGDLAAAVATLQTLSGPAAAAAQPWLAAARRRLEAEAALARLQRMLAAAIVRQAAPAPPAPPQSAPPPKPEGTRSSL
ncbi:MAG TPA: mitofilin family membrane protein [Stellaceae bacterium]|nr:mitofilin family membrane protein [Stellaceae bacterium]